MSDRDEKTWALVEARTLLVNSGIEMPLYRERLEDSIAAALRSAYEQGRAEGQAALDEERRICQRAYDALILAQDVLRWVKDGMPDKDHWLEQMKKDAAEAVEFSLMRARSDAGKG